MAIDEDADAQSADTDENSTENEEEKTANDPNAAIVAQNEELKK